MLPSIPDIHAYKSLRIPSLCDMVQAFYGRSFENDKNRNCSQADVERGVHRGTHGTNHLYVPRGFYGSIVSEVSMRDLSGKSLKVAPQKDTEFSNISSFLEHTTPSVSVHHLPQSYWNSMVGPGRSFKTGTEESVPFFNLDEFWDAFGEWSVYGAGVPLVCPGQDNSCQYYYTPTLSALQLYEDAPRGRRCESDDGSDAEYSESSDSDHDRHFHFHESETSSEGSHCEIAWLDEEAGEGEECRRAGRPAEKRLLFEFFETSSPYNRVPLSDQIAELGDSHPAIKGLRSIDLHPGSWFAVAWYPVYRIPTGPASSDASASFLTYHSLSALPMEAGKALSYHKQVQLSQGSCMQGEPIDTRCTQKLFLPAFGLASYKCQGSFWNSTSSFQHKKVMALQAGAKEWLREQKISHPDFQFFSTRGGGSIGY